ncbi:DNA primase [Deltaproteobacteria bacterium Smac51]|nr:DNA primase [Deltaproteobacteria bacterium Smac51]
MSDEKPDYRAMVKARVEAEKASDLTPEPVRPELSDFQITTCAKENRAGDAAVFIAINHGKYLYIKRQREWLQWVGHYWQKDIDAAEALAAVETVVDEYRRVAAGWWKSLNEHGGDHQKMEDLPDEVLESKGGNAKDQTIKRNLKALNSKISQLHDDTPREKVLKFARTCKDKRMVIEGLELDTKPWLLAAPNGVIELKTGRLRPGRPDDYITCAVATEWLGLEAQCPDFENFLLSALGGDVELVNYMRRMLGHALIGKQREHVFLVLSGAKGRNGKGTLMKILEQVLGPSIMSPVPSEMFLDQGYAKSSSGPAADIMSLKGLRIAYASETDEGRRFSSSKVKWLSGGDRIVARGVYGVEMSHWDSTHTLILLTNDLPHARADDQAFWSRVHLVPFRYSFLPHPNPNNEFERQADPDLYEKLAAEAPGILAWLVRGCREYLENGLNPPPQVTEATQAYRENEDLIGRFISECCNVGSGCQVQSSDLYDHFSFWYEQEVSRKREFSNKRFSEIMAKKGFEKKKVSAMFWIGIDLTDEFKQLRVKSESEGKSGKSSLWEV